MLTRHKLKGEEPLHKGIKRIATSINKLAITHIVKLKETDPHEAVHQLRKRFKEQRALVRLIKNELDETLYDSENMFYRDLGREISEIRDIKAFMEALELLEELHEGKLYKNAFSKTRSFLQDRLLHLEDEIKLPEKLEHMRVLLLTHEKGIKQWPLKFKSYKTLTYNLKDSYKKGYKLLKEVKGKPTITNIHEWRKQAKYITNQLYIITRIWPEMLSTLEKEFHRLADLTGDDHDLAELLKFLESNVPDEEEFHLLKAIINDQRKALQFQALQLGPKLYCETPENFTSRINGYWKAHMQTLTQ